MEKRPDRLGARASIRRRDFINGVLAGSAGAVAFRALPGCAHAGKDDSGLGTVPPAADRADDYTNCHALRDGDSFDIPAASGDLLDCVIIGGGPSGLMAAWMLARLGASSVLVLEKEAPAGGFCRSDTHYGSVVTRAADYTAVPETRDLIDLYLDLGLVTESGGSVTPNPDLVARSPKLRQYIDGAWYDDPWADEAGRGIERLPFPANVIADLKAFRADAQSWWDRRGSDGLWAFDLPDDASADPEIRALDAITFAEYVAGKGWDPAVSDYLSASVQASYALPSSELSAWVAMFELCADVWGGETDEDAGDLAATGGLAFLTEALVDKVGADHLTTGAIVLRAVETDGEVQITYLSEGVTTTLRARTAIYAAPRYMAPYVVPGLGDAGRDESSAFRFTPYLVAQVFVDQTPAKLAWYNEVVSGACFLGFTVADWHDYRDPASAPLTRSNALTVYMPLTEADRPALLTTPIEDYEEAILADLERVLPGVRDTVVAFDLYRWGHAMVAARPGFLFGAERIAAKEPLGAISFACTDLEGIPTFECAAASAFRAAREVAALL